MKMTQSILFLLVLLFATGCLEVAGGGIDSELIPDIQIECPGIICPATSSVVMVGFLQDPNVDCEEYLANLNTTNYSTAFDARGTTTASQSGPILLGTVTSWFNFNNAAVVEITNGQYRVCGHYDANNNQYLDSGEAFGDMLVYPGTSPQIMDDWLNF